MTFKALLVQVDLTLTQENVSHYQNAVTSGRLGKAQESSGGLKEALEGLGVFQICSDQALRGLMADNDTFRYLGGLR